MKIAPILLLYALTGRNFKKICNKIIQNQLITNFVKFFK